jgi:hypothetical protein
MKTILLQFKDCRSTEPMKPRRWTVIAESEDHNTLSIQYTHVFSDKSRSVSVYTIVKQADGSWKSDTGCEYVQVKLDRRPKPFSIESQEEGRGPKTVHKFATAGELAEYVKGRWQGWDYYDGDNSFHNDYATFTVKGVDLSLLVEPRENPGDLTEVLAKFAAREVAAENGYSDWEIRNEMESQ